MIVECHPTLGGDLFAVLVTISRLNIKAASANTRSPTSASANADGCGTGCFSVPSISSHRSSPLAFRLLRTGLNLAIVSGSLVGSHLSYPVTDFQVLSNGILLIIDHPSRRMSS